MCFVLFVFVCVALCGVFVVVVAAGFSLYNINV